MPLLTPELNIAIGFILGFIYAGFIFSVFSAIGQNDDRKIRKSLILFSVSITLLTFTFFFTANGGLLSEWKQIRLPNYEKATKIIDTHYVQGASGNNYHLVCLECPEDKRWERTGDITKNEELEFVEPLNNCGTFSFLPRVKEDFVMTNISCVVNGPGVSKIAYAIDKGGSVYIWKHSINEYDDFVPFAFSIVIGLASGLVGIITILLVFFMYSLKTKIMKTES